MDYKEFSDSMGKILNEMPIHDVLGQIESRLADKVDELNEIYEESGLEGNVKDRALLLAPSKFQRLLDEVHAAKHTAVLIE